MASELHDGSADKMTAGDERFGHIEHTQNKKEYQCGGGVLW